MGQTLFSHDTELTLRAICVLINTDRVAGEQLGDQPALNAYLHEHGWTGRRDHDAALGHIGGNIGGDIGIDHDRYVFTRRWLCRFGFGRSCGGSGNLAR